MRLVHCCWLSVLTSALGCGDIDNGGIPRRKVDAPSSTGGTGATNGNTNTGDGRTTIGSGGSAGASGNAGAGGSTGPGATTGAGGNAAGGSTGTGATGGSGGNAGSGGSVGTGGAGNGGSDGGKDVGTGGAATGGSNGMDAAVKSDATGAGGSRIADGGGASADVAAERAETSAPPSSGLWVLPNHPWYEWSAVPADQVPWQHLTHLGLGSLQPQLSNGTYIAGAPAGWGTGWTGFHDSAKGFADAGHAASRKVFMMLGAAQSNAGNFAGVWNAATSAANVDAFADNVVSVLKDMGLDGVELDWEENIDYGQLVTLAKKIRARWADGLIFIDVLPLDDGSNFFASLAPAKDDIDAFMPMTFLSIPQWGGWVLPIPLTPLYGYAGNGYSVDDNLKKWTAAGVPASKVIMGVGGFGSVWGDSNSDQTAPIAPYITVSGSGGANGETGSLYDDRVVTWSWVKNMLANNSSRMIEEWDDLGKCSYWHAPATNDLVATTAQSKSIQASLVFYETTRSMTEKLKYASAQSMRGMNFWTLSQTMDGTSSPILETVMR